MPAPKGWPKGRVAKRDRLAKKLEHDRKVGNPYAVAAAALKPRRKRKKS